METVMSWDRIGVDLVGLGLIGFIVWFFWLAKAKGVKAALTSRGYQEQMVLVKGGYTPDVIVVERGQPVRLNFVRQESASCSEMVLSRRSTKALNFRKERLSRSNLCLKRLESMSSRVRWGCSREK
jgi:plastocyanin domain-containing protein